MSDNPWVRKHSVKDSNHGRLAEAKASRRLKGVLVPGSGNGSIKGDFTLDMFKVENKSTINISLSIKYEWLMKIKQEAKEVNKIPALSFQFVDVKGNPIKYGNWVCIEESVFAQLIEGRDDIL
ncbi:MAG: hypothetical protein KAH32_07260 [Chlamydiia bacterium]|nr:hypothetical protein [Chlamydiia bacterium]